MRTRPVQPEAALLPPGLYHSGMTRAAASRLLTLPPREPGVPATHWLYESLRRSVLDGRLRAGGRLPSTRDLARTYGVARGTVVTAFEQLKTEGYLHATVGSGTFVASALPGRMPERSRAARGSVALKRASRISTYAKRVRPFDEGITAERIPAFRTNRPALDLFPVTVWSTVASRRVRRATRSLLHGCGPTGYPPLREAVADCLVRARGAACHPEQVVIVSGVQEALDLVARLLLDPGDRVVMENPGYFGAGAIFEAAGATVVPVPVDDEGLTIDADVLRNARLVYVTPAHQFPLGVSMSLTRRLALLQCAANTGALIFEDDYDSEYRYAGRPIPALQGLDRHGHVIFAGSFNKLLFPALRLGYLVVPTDLVEPLAALKSMTSRHLPSLEQAILADFIAEGHFGRHLRRMREVYAERLAILSASADEHLSGLLRIARIEAGLQTVGWLSASLTAEAAARAAADRGVEVTPLNKYWRGRPTAQGLSLGFAAIDPVDIQRGVRQLGAALKELSRGR